MTVLGENSRNGTDERKRFPRYNTRKVFWKGKQNVVCTIKGHIHSRRDCKTKWSTWGILFILLNNKNFKKNDFSSQVYKETKKIIYKEWISGWFQISVKFNYRRKWTNICTNVIQKKIPVHEFIGPKGSTQ